MKHLHTFNQHLNESQIRVIPNREYLQLTSTHNLLLTSTHDRDKIKKRSFTRDERTMLGDLYEALDPDRTGKYRVKYHAKFEIIPDEDDNDFPRMEIAKVSESRWLIKITDENDTYSVYEANSLDSLVDHLKVKYGPDLGMDWIEIK